MAFERRQPENEKNGQLKLDPFSTNSMCTHTLSKLI